MGKAWDLPNKSEWNYFDVEAVPLYSIIAAVGYPEIDFLSLDVEGIELDVLKYFPFAKVTIKVIIAEIYFLSETERKEFVNLLNNHGYSLDKKYDVDWVH